MEAKYNEFKALLAEIADLAHAAGLLGWDQQVLMPPGGASGRANAMSTVGRILHEKATAPETGRMLDELEKWTATLDPDSDEARLVRVSRRAYDKQVKVPSQWVVDNAQARALAHHVWQEARAENNFAKFQPHLERILDLRRQYADFFAPYDHVYDALLDDFEPGLKTADVKAIFNALRPKQVELLQKIAAQPEIDNEFLHLTYDTKRQWDFGVDVITRFGYDWKRGRQDYSAHPFTSNFGKNDVRITTRAFPNDLGSALFSTMHEAGHAMYEQGSPDAFERTPMAGGASLAIHESQSRLWENLVGRSLPFWEHFYPSLQATFPDQLNSISLERFYRAINKVQPSLIRVEADEATYNLHIMLRLELEMALMEGAVAVKDLPEAWNSRMEDYLGITPPNDANGVLQDVHWSSGLVGYFSTYALGNLISVQLWERLHQDIPDLDDQIRQGEFSALLGWLGAKIHGYGAKFEPQELVQRVTGSKIDPAPYLRYLNEKYSQVYGLG